MHKQNPVQFTSSDAWDFDLLSPSASSASTSAIPSLSLVPSPSIAGTSNTSIRNASPIDDFELAFDPLPPKPTAPKAKPVVFQDEDEEDASLLTDIDSLRIKRDAQNLLDSLGQSNTPTSSTTRASRPKQRSNSPPPHVLGQLVELGFSIPESRQALQNTYTDKWNVNQAADSLLSSQRSSRPSSTQPEHAPRSDAIPRKASPSTAGTGSTQEDLLAQASVLGNTLFKQANAFWGKGKKAVVKAIEEQRVASGSGSGRASPANSADARPKWMMEAVDQEDWKEEKQKSGELFKDVSDEEEQQSTRPAKTTPSTASVASIAKPQPKAQAPKVYQSSARRAVPQRSNNPTPPPAAPSISATPPLKRTFARTPIACSTHALHQATQHRKQGNEHFKLGRYAEAESSYSSALAILPPNHLSTLAALNNRANARLKTGNERGAIEDATLVITVILAGENLDVNALEEESARLKTSYVDAPNLREQLGKGLVRRAQGFEASEKWQLAVQDYETILGGGEGLLRPAGGSGVVSSGLTRCRKALAPKTKPKPPVQQKIKSVVPVRDSRAVNELRATAKAAEKDEATKDSLKDSVDERVVAWKGGKEANIRALVASLDTVLWSELEWKKVGMHELISEGQLKVRYMRAIGKLHPDKVCRELSRFPLGLLKW